MTRRNPIFSGVLSFSCILLLATGEPAYGQRMLRGGEDPQRPALRKVAPRSKGASQTPAGNAKPSRPTPKPAAPAGKSSARPTTASLMETIAWQAALDRADFSPGIIDGVMGAKTRAAIRAFQAHAGLPETGDIDLATADALGLDDAPAVRRYTLTGDDAADVGPIPQSWVAKSRLSRLPYPTLAALVAERGHCSQRLLTKLNPEVNVQKLKAGDSVTIPHIEAAAAPRAGSRVEIDFSTKRINVYDQADKLVGLFHCSIAKHKSKRPSGPCQVQTIVPSPKYMFDPAHWPEVKGITQKLLIPAGPRNPVGLCWIGLSKKGYGIHGTPEPENIGKTGSHGCFRLANWDAVRLSQMVRVGTPVHFLDGADRVASR